LRAENRALLNSILGIAGVRPIAVAADEVAGAAALGSGLAQPKPERGPTPTGKRSGENPARVESSPALGVKQGAPRVSAERGMSSVARPRRRRSWHQIYRILEIDAARKKEAVSLLAARFCRPSAHEQTHLFSIAGVTSFECGGNMPFIRGRYHINAIAGEALEAAHEAEAAPPALEHDATQADSDDGGDESASGSGKGPIHRVEIEAAEVAPARSGRAQRGFVAHVHREAILPDQSGRGFVQSAASGDSIGSGDVPGARFASLRSPQAGQVPTAGNASRPETHVFADHRDLVNFLRDQFAKFCGRG